MEEIKSDLIEVLFQKKGPYGAIITPTNKTGTGSVVDVTGETENIKNDRYVWLVVEKPEYGLCWPKSYRIKPNIEFKTIVYKEGRPLQLVSIRRQRPDK